MTKPSSKAGIFSATIDFRVLRDGWVKLAIFTLKGKQVRQLHNEPMISGAYSMKWDGNDDEGWAVQAKQYIARLEAEGMDLRQNIELIECC